MIDKLEKKLGKYAIKNLIYYILGGYIIGYILYIFDSSLNLYQYITLSPAMVMQGQVWRIFTWILTIPESLSIWIIFMFLFYFFIGRSLEQNMGAFRYNLYMFSGWFFMTFGAMIIYWVSAPSGVAISMNTSTYYINMASFLAFAVLFPDVKVYFFGILPIKIKILAWIDAGLLIAEVVSYATILLAMNVDLPEVQEMITAYGLEGYYTSTQCITQIFSILVSVLNFLIFFIMNLKVRAKNRKRQQEFKNKYNQGQAYANRTYTFTQAQNSYGQADSNQNRQAEKKVYRPDSAGTLVHQCCICGRTSTDYPDLQFRYCSKCSGSHEYCQDHLFTHTHVK